MDQVLSKLLKRAWMDEICERDFPTGSAWYLVGEVRRVKNSQKRDKHEESKHINNGKGKRSWSDFPALQEAREGDQSFLHCNPCRLCGSSLVLGDGGEWSSLVLKRWTIPGITVDVEGWKGTCYCPVSGIVNGWWLSMATKGLGKQGQPSDCVAKAS